MKVIASLSTSETEYLYRNYYLAFRIQLFATVTEAIFIIKNEFFIVVKLTDDTNLIIPFINYLLAED